MAKYRTAQGKVIDMAQLASKNEKVRAVGNMPVNARGDTIDSHGKVIVPVTRKVNSNYERAVATKSTKAVVPDVVEPTITVETPVVEDTDMTAEEISQLEEFDNEDVGFVIKSADEAPDFFEPEETAKPRSTRKTK